MKIKKFDDQRFPFTTVKRLAVKDGRDFKLSSSFAPSGDQPQAIAELVAGLDGGADVGGLGELVPLC